MCFLWNFLCQDRIVKFNRTTLLNKTWIETSFTLHLANSDWESNWEAGCTIPLEKSRASAQIRVPNRHQKRDWTNILRMVPFLLWSLPSGSGHKMVMSRVLLPPVETRAGSEWVPGSSTSPAGKALSVHLNCLGPKRDPRRGPQHWLV